MIVAGISFHQIAEQLIRVEVKDGVSAQVSKQFKLIPRF